MKSLMLMSKSFFEGRVIVLVVCLLCFTNVKSQVISQFDFDSDPITTALVGPDGTTVSASAFSDAGGVGGTNGVNAGLPKADINMVIPGSPTFDVDGIDVSFDYHREENAGSFFVRGASLEIQGCNNLSVRYRVDDGGGGFVLINSGTAYAIPNDDTYRNYRFAYTPCDGVGILFVDGVSVWTNDGPDNRPLYWTGAGDVTVCDRIDGTGNNDTFFDNLIVGEVDCSLLPIELSAFDVVADACYTRIAWKTLSERDSDYFTVQKSLDGVNWFDLESVKGAGTSSVPHTYSYTDSTNYDGVAYYRLRQVDFDGEFELYNPKSIEHNGCGYAGPYPNPAKESIYLASIDADLQIYIYTLTGQDLTTKVQINYEEKTIDLSMLDAGSYILVVDNESYPIQKID